MKIEKANINDLISPDYNPRDISPEALESLKKSIEEFGYIDPLIVNKHNNHIVGGNQRFEALRQLGVKEVEVSYVDIDDINKEKALNVRLNNNSGVWNEIKLQDILVGLKVEDVDISLTGFENIKLDIPDEINFDNDDIFTEEKKEKNPPKETIPTREYDNKDLEELYTEEDKIQNNIRATNFDDEWGLSAKVRFNNPIDEDLFYEFIEKLKKEMGANTITENIIKYFNLNLQRRLTSQQFKSDFEVIFKNEDEKKEYANILNELKIRYPKSTEPLIDYIKEFENGL